MPQMEGSMVRVVAQRVRSARVKVDAEIVGSIGRGLILFVGIGQGDDDFAVNRTADKVAEMRVFEDAAGKTNLSASGAGGAMLVVSQFTLYGDLRHGRRPSFTEAAHPDLARTLCDRFSERLRTHGYQVQHGVFGSHMLVSMENDGPFTLVLDSAEL